MDDCIIIGGGPAGLTAAIYLSRYHLKIRLFDCGSSRAALIPCTHNHAGYPEGVSGLDLLAAMRAQAEKYGTVREAAKVTALRTVDGGFAAQIGEREVRARSVLLATGVVNHRPPMPDGLHDAALAQGRIRYCPVCDGYEVTDKRVAVYGTGEHAAREALFVRSFTRDVTLIAPDAHDLPPAQQAELDAAGIERIDGPARDWAIEGEELTLSAAGGRFAFDSLYPALGSHIRSELAVQAGARADPSGCLEVDDHQRTSLAGLFAAGDVAKGLDQISHAMGEAGVAATTIRNMLNAEAPLWR
ncbi:NAD(P)/FAD-dependent oxidoreductase [Sphingomonas sp. HT-1]|uniref:NAD(P)/FAD-dependent oxidoreductase n=1 Tax=unclassified Sphingomonas TaxID=196159 RepID=UPI0002F31BD1|nr:MULTISPECIES: NAD(P)/FAD-dependent oxidoreductase [unclassified Sphingomonas]KTF70094.1 thioredoxin reductase [Sphingomonas sp. WG]